MELDAPISILDWRRLIVVPSSLALTRIRELCEEYDSPVLLVQDSPDTIEGVVSRDAIDDIYGWSDGAHEMSAAQVIERNIAIEPDSVSIGEVLERLVEGEARYTVIVDRLGRPQSVISPEILKEKLAA